MFDIGVAIKWLLFLALVPMAFIWLRRAWRIFVRHDYSEVALKRGESPPNPKKWALWTGLTNLAAGTVAVVILLSIPVYILFGVSLFALHQGESWYAVAGSTIWMKLIMDYIISRQAHPFILGKKKQAPKETTRD